MKRQAHGFTFIELIVVVFILLLMAGIGLPIFNSYQSRNSLRQAANLLATDIGRAEEEARKIGIACNPASCAPNPPCPVGCRGINSQGASPSLAVINTFNTVVFSDVLPPNTTIFAASNAAPATPNLLPLTQCVGAAGLQFSNSTTGLVFNAQGKPVTCTGADFPVATTTEILTLSDTRGNNFIVTVDTRSGVVSGP